MYLLHLPLSPSPTLFTSVLLINFLISRIAPPGFCGFRPYAEIRRFLTEVPEFRQVVTEGLAKAFCQAVEGNSHHQIQKFAMKACFSSIYDREEAFVQLNVKEMIARLKKTPGEELPNYSSQR